MTENMNKFLELVSQNTELAAKVNVADKNELIAMAKEMGIDLTEADFAQQAAELSDDELDAVAGGGVCVCVAGGGGSKKGASDDAKKYWNGLDACACVLGGMGYYGNGDRIRCTCMVGGNGSN